MSHWITAAILLLWTVLGTGAGVDGQPRLAQTDTQEISSTAPLPADELPDDLDAARPEAADHTPRGGLIAGPRDVQLPYGSTAERRARGPPSDLPV